MAHFIVELNADDTVNASYAMVCQQQEGGGATARQ